MMHSALFSIVLSAVSVLALPGLRLPQHHHHVKRDDVIVYATVQVTQYITMTAGQSTINDHLSATGAILGTAGNVAYAASSTPVTTSSIINAGNVVLAANNVISSSTTTSSSPSTLSTSVKATSTSTTPTTSAAVSTSSASSTSSNSKRGLAWASDNPSSMTSLFSTSALSWYFNWGTSATSGLSETFIYQQWGSNNLANVKKLPTGSTLIGFNEPDGTGQATMTAAEAAAYYKSTFTPLRKTGQIGSLGTPSITNGGSGIIWLKAFMAACSDCEIDFISAHWYGPSLSLLQSQMEAIHTAFGLPVWITEMACTEWSTASNPTQAEISSFMGSALTWMDSQSWIAKYAWFGAMIISDGTLGAGNMLVTSDGSALSALGKQYLYS